MSGRCCRRVDLEVLEKDTVTHDLGGHTQGFDRDASTSTDLPDMYLARKNGTMKYLVRSDTTKALNRSTYANRVRCICRPPFSTDRRCIGCCFSRPTSLYRAQRSIISRAGLCRVHDARIREYRKRPESVRSAPCSTIRIILGGKRSWSLCDP